MMKMVSVLAALGTMVLAQPAFAQLEAYKDYNIAESTSIVTTVKVDSNMMDYYLEGLKSSWAPANDIAIKLGHMDSYSIFASALPASGQFNLVLVTNFKNTGDLGPSKAKYEAFMTQWGEKREKESRAISKTYPNVRKITGSYIMNEITFVK